MTAAQRGTRTTSIVLVIVFAAVSVVGLLLSASRASAVFTELTESGTPGYLVLAQDTTTPLWSSLQPGQSTYWLIQASLHDAEGGTLAIELRGNGDLIEHGGLTGSVDACAGTFDLSSLTCAGSRTTAVAPVALSSLPSTGEQVRLADIKQGAPRELLVTLTLPSTTVITAGERPSARIGLGVHASGTGKPEVTPITPVRSVPPQLSVTGADVLPLGLLAAGLLGLGAALGWRRRVTR